MTTDTADAVRRLRCALFVDFDNVYLGLKRLDPAAAEAFAGSPGHWLAALETGSDPDGDFVRRFLVRACYLNPSAFSAFRPNFTRAGFSVVDCPSLTQQGKSSADINLVLDAVDALTGPTRYDEFVILSADADFTPLALKLRAADRRVTIITAGPAASAYRAVADTVVTADELAELVREPRLVLDLADAQGGRAKASPAKVAPATPTAPPAAATTAPRAGRAPATRAAGAPTSAPAGPAVPPAGARTAPPKPAATSAPAAPGAATAKPSPARRAVLRLVRAADGPLPGSQVAQAAQKSDPSLPASGWAGAGAFFAWLARAVPELGAATKPPPGFVWDPTRFAESDLPGAEVDLPPLQRQVVEVTDIPNLPTERYRALLTALAEDVAATPFERAETTRRVRDVLQAAGQQVGRSSVNTVVAGVLYAGLDLRSAPGVEEVAMTWADNVIGLCRGARMEMGPNDVAAVRAWVSGGLAQP